jgi:hypothetical protein
MRFTWPPSEEKGWEIQSFHQTEKNKKTFFLPLQKQDHLLLAIRINAKESTIHIEIPVAEKKWFALTVSPNEWTMLPFPIEQHAIGAVWDHLELSIEECTIELGYYMWATRNFRMRAMVDSEKKVLFAYRINKKGNTDTYFPPKDHIMTLPEDTYIVPPTCQINEKSILLVSSQSNIDAKKTPESRYFSL